MEEEVINKKKECIKAKEKTIEEEKDKYEKNEKEHANKVGQYKKDIDLLTQETEGIIQLRKDCENEIMNLEQEKEQLVNELTSLQKMYNILKIEEESLQMTLTTNNLEIESIIIRSNELGKENERINDELIKLQNRSKIFYEYRKERHNYMQELKGNIRIFCRVRPRLTTDPPGKDILEVLNTSTLEITPPHFLLGANPNKTLREERFTFNKVFPVTTGQEEVFEEVNSFIKSALDGFNVTIFSYGGTDTGKTFTIEGDLLDKKKYGLIPRSINKLISGTEELTKWGWKCDLLLSTQEIYNDKLLDLLSKDNDSLQSTGLKTYQPTEISITSQEELIKLLRMTNKNKAIMEGKLNVNASRCHCVYQIKIIGKNASTGKSLESALNFVHLATYDKQNESSQESKNISKTMNTLKDVINAIAEKKEYIPARNSKLTQLLKDFLINGKILMIVNVSPVSASYTQTLQSLKFASKIHPLNKRTY